MMSGVALVALKQRNISLKQCELFPVIDCSSWGNSPTSSTCVLNCQNFA